MWVLPALIDPAGIRKGGIRCSTVGRLDYVLTSINGGYGGGCWIFYWGCRAGEKGSRVCGEVGDMCIFGSQYIEREIATNE